MLNAALWYADLGYDVFPCIRGGKKPITLHGLKDASFKPERVEEWWTEHPDANVAIRTDGLLVVDIDGTDNLWLTDCPEKLEELARAPSSQTPRGGRHFWFRQPSGKAWRCTQGRLAEKVDTRANGGYVVAPPSSVKGRAYQWLEGYELDVGPDGLPEPPARLAEQLDQIATQSSLASAVGDDDAQIPEGRRNGVLTSLAGSMRRIGMRQAEIAAALHQVNAGRCVPPLHAREVDRIAASVARYEPNQIATAVAEGYWQQMVDAPPIQPLSVRDIVVKYPALREPVIHGLLREGETMNVISAPKIGKSWLVIDLALAITTGRPWLGMNCVPGEVLILDNELHGETSAHRIPKVATARGIDIDEIDERLYVENLRGRLQDLFSLGPYFRQFAPGRFKVVILDAFYRFLPMRADENDNGTMASLYNYLDSFADYLKCCFVLIHHTSKGNQSLKDITDVGAGAGAQSRATDTHLVLRRHEEDDAVVLDAAVRSWPPVPPRCLRWAFPVWMPADDLEPTALRKEGGKRSARKEEKEQAPSYDAASFTKRFLGSEPKSQARIQEEIEAENLSSRRVKQLLELAEEDGLVFRWKLNNKRTGYATRPQLEQSDDDAANATPSKRQAVEGLLQATPELTNANVAQQCGVSDRYVRQIRTELEGQSRVD
jgi:hypothetical protein